MRALVLDIETAPALARVWGVNQQFISPSQVVRPVEMLCFAAKWHGQRKVVFRSTFHDGVEAMLAELWQLVDDSEAIIHYNGQRFDMPHINREFLLAGMERPSPYAHIDLLRTMRSQFRFMSNKLDSVSRNLGLGSKVAHEGMGLWDKCIEGDERAWARMRRYNIGDVRLTESLYDRILPWIQAHPNRGLHDDRPLSCPRCGSDRMQRNGVRRTQTMTYARYRCGACGGHARGRQSEGSAALVAI